ncbi:MAG: hypothetical protein LBH08_00935 [Puniceicoccales bacterium]|jgi:hypothetical protein|nr:hypothetical protein [Puniceicoccales bacterium]
MSIKIIKIGLELLVLSVATENIWGACDQASSPSVPEIVMSPLLDCEPVEVSFEPQQESSPTSKPDENIEGAEGS